MAKSRVRAPPLPPFVFPVFIGFPTGSHLWEIFCPQFAHNFYRFGGEKTVLVAMNKRAEFPKVCKRHGITVTIFKQERDGYSKYRVVYYEAGRRKELCRADYAAAMAEAEPRSICAVTTARSSSPRWCRRGCVSIRSKPSISSWGVRGRTVLWKASTGGSGTSV